jgi:hypothetical protein
MCGGQRADDCLNRLLHFRVGQRAIPIPEGQPDGQSHVPPRRQSPAAVKFRPRVSGPSQIRVAARTPEASMAMDIALGFGIPASPNAPRTHGI